MEKIKKVLTKEELEKIEKEKSKEKSARLYPNPETGVMLTEDEYKNYLEKKRDQK